MYNQLIQYIKYQKKKKKILVLIIIIIINNISIERVSASVHGYGSESYILETQSNVHFQISYPNLNVFPHQVKAHGYDTHAQQ